MRTHLAAPRYHFLNNSLKLDKVEPKTRMLPGLSPLRLQQTLYLYIKRNMSVLIARFKSKREASFAAKLIKRYRKSSKVLTGESLEDLYMGEMIEEGMQEKGTISKETFKKYLDKRISALS